MKRVTIDTNVIGDALNEGREFRRLVVSGVYHVRVSVSGTTLSGILNLEDTVAIVR